eukprot:CAMPEP_0183366894 /NCGR_PEP_ID=MMETSP0164_2-20130417/90498_1 /TAXON_ID=221442 /ORGANISM="Coccolithus pelagicus ssp braarudi, Strain PLY182g" /LENGTH=486 /DNA_ID=CAMNT_0025542729 /DNA_START=15 /DNA_END=1475 /DNA_ORIENTATION=-
MEQDTHDLCTTWAEAGECAINPTFMRAECARSCADADKLGTVPKVSQLKKECKGYADMGECARNPAFMLSSCRAECDAWEAREGVKIDRDGRCVQWSILGKCESDAAHMATECNTSCTIHQRCRRSSFSGWSVGVCDKALRCEVADKRSDCVSRAALGECTSDATYMAQKCLATCAANDVDGVLSAQRPKMRVRFTQHIDIPRSMSQLHERCWLPGWSGHNQYKLMLPTRCAAPVKLPWQRLRSTRARLKAEIDDQITCPVDVQLTTPRVLVPSKNVSILPHTPHQVLVQQVLASPRVRLLHDFITAEEADEILRVAEPLFRRSPVRSVATDRRTSSTATVGTRGGAIERVRKRISAFSGYDEEMLEPLQVVRYHPGEKYEPHHDLFDICDFPQKPRRQLTFLIYLNELPLSAGGDTTFPRLGLRIHPRKYTALVFNDVLDSGMDDERTEHGGSAPSSGIKYAINCWIRARGMSDTQSWFAHHGLD